MWVSIGVITGKPGNNGALVQISEIVADLSTLDKSTLLSQGGSLGGALKWRRFPQPQVVSEG